MLDPLPVRVIASSRRRKTVAARVVDGTIEVRVPEALSASDREHHVARLVSRIERRRSAERIDLDARARALARLYDLPAPTSVSWSSRQNQRWGSCTPADGALRLSDRMTGFPLWVIDYVLVHELAHLTEANHSPLFHQLVQRYPMAERAEGFLIAVSMGHVTA